MRKGYGMDCTCIALAWRNFRSNAMETENGWFLIVLMSVVLLPPTKKKIFKSIGLMLHYFLSKKYQDSVCFRRFLLLDSWFFPCWKKIPIFPTERWQEINNWGITINIHTKRHFLCLYDSSYQVYYLISSWPAIYNSIDLHIFFFDFTIRSDLIRNICFEIKLYY